MNHLVLLGDSIFDNAAYVGGAPSVIDQLRDFLPSGWRATLLAVDGSVTFDVLNQCKRIPSDATYLAISVGGNDALGVLPRLHSPAAMSMMQALRVLSDIQVGFERNYREILRAVRATDLPVLCCTIYDQVPGLTRELRTALSVFNDVIARECSRFENPVMELRAVCTEAADYSVVSPIEPSSVGGQKIARRISEIVSGTSGDTGGQQTRA